MFWSGLWVDKERRIFYNVGLHLTCTVFPVLAKNFIPGHLSYQRNYWLVGNGNALIWKTSFSPLLLESAHPSKSRVQSIVYGIETRAREQPNGRIRNSGSYSYSTTSGSLGELDFEPLEDKIRDCKAKWDTFEESSTRSVKCTFIYIQEYSPMKNSC